MSYVRFWWTCVTKNNIFVASFRGASAGHLPDFLECRTASLRQFAHKFAETVVFAPGYLSIKHMKFTSVVITRPRSTQCKPSQTATSQILFHIQQVNEHVNAQSNMIETLLHEPAERDCRFCERHLAQNIISLFSWLAVLEVEA